MKEDFKIVFFNYVIDYNMSIKFFKYYGKYFVGLVKIIYYSIFEGYIL